MDINKLMAEALVEQGYAFKYEDGMLHVERKIGVSGLTGKHGELLQPFSDSLSGYRQLFALVDWLRARQPVLIGMRMIAQQYSNISSSHNELCNLVKWCFSQLAGVSDDDN